MIFFGKFSCYRKEKLHNVWVKTRWFVGKKLKYRKHLQNFIIFIILVQFHFSYLNKYLDKEQNKCFWEIKSVFLKKLKKTYNFETVSLKIFKIQRIVPQNFCNHSKLQFCSSAVLILRNIQLLWTRIIFNRADMFWLTPTGAWSSDSLLFF